jgi:hypothetical protein
MLILKMLLVKHISNIYLKTKNETSQAVAVVPILAPIITEIACDRLIRPALTKLTIITVVADDD